VNTASIGNRGKTPGGLKFPWAVVVRPIDSV
jgi:hypothetical protein